MDLAKLFGDQRVLINQFFDQVGNFTNITKIVEFVALIENCQGTVYFTAIGKSGNVANNISQMLASIGFRSGFIDPIEAMHGGVGAIRKDDLVVIMSKSAQTVELLQLQLILKSKEIPIVAIVSNPNGTLLEKADYVIVLPVQQELCPFDLAPTTSTIIQLIFGNTVVAYLMNKTQLTRDNYALNHPAGRIGKRLTVRVKDVMRTGSALPICGPADVLADVLNVMNAKKCGCLIVVDNNKLLGILTEIPKDINLPLENIMSLNVQMIGPDIMACEVEKAEQIVVVDSEKNVLGLLLVQDLVQWGL